MKIIHQFLLAVKANSLRFTWFICDFYFIILIVVLPPLLESFHALTPPPSRGVLHTYKHRFKLLPFRLKMHIRDRKVLNLFPFVNFNVICKFNN